VKAHQGLLWSIGPNRTRNRGRRCDTGGIDDAGWEPIERSDDPKTVRDALAARDDPPSPAPEESMIRTCGSCARALKLLGRAGWIACDSAALADLVACHWLSAAPHRHSRERHRVVLSQNKARLREALRTRGFGACRGRSGGR
jgi:hypothetical protein